MKISNKLLHRSRTINVPFVRKVMELFDIFALKFGSYDKFAYENIDYRSFGAFARLLGL